MRFTGRLTWGLFGRVLRGGPLPGCLTRQLISGGFLVHFMQSSGRFTGHFTMRFTEPLTEGFTGAYTGQFTGRFTGRSRKELLAESKKGASAFT
jgi:hypothetical protein